jgi:hypothetical protein
MFLKDYAKNLLLNNVCENCRSYMEFVGNSASFPLIPRCIHPEGNKLKDRTCEQFKKKVK